MAVLAHAAPQGLFWAAQWHGHLPSTTYARLGFETVGAEREVPEWARGHGPQDVVDEVEAAVASGRSREDFRTQAMMLDLRSGQ